METIRAVSGSSPELLHVHAGLCIWILAALVMRRPLRSFAPLGAVIVAEIFNEGMDRLFWGEWRPDTLSDIVLTCMWPLALTLLLRSSALLRR